MTGFLGTVVGMIQAFHKMASSGGQIEVGALSEGIYTAMTTTVVGLVVGIIAYVGYNHLVVKTDKIVHQMEANAIQTSLHRHTRCVQRCRRLESVPHSPIWPIKHLWFSLCLHLRTEDQPLHKLTYFTLFLDFYKNSFNKRFAQRFRKEIAFFE